MVRSQASEPLERFEKHDRCNVYSWHLADIPIALANVRYPTKADIAA
jgi:hypothetical protein